MTKEYTVKLPCLPGDDLYWLDNEDGEWSVKCTRNGIGAVLVEKGQVHRIISRDDLADMNGMIETIGTSYAHLTRESAERELAELQREEEEMEKATGWHRKAKKQPKQGQIVFVRRMHGEVVLARYSGVEFMIADEFGWKDAWDVEWWKEMPNDG